MKTIIENATNLSMYVFQDDEAVNFPATRARTHTMVEGVTIPEDWTGNKYTYADGAFALNPDWTDPAEAVEEA